MSFAAGSMLRVNLQNIFILCYWSFDLWPFDHLPLPLPQTLGNHSFGFYFYEFVYFSKLYIFFKLFTYLFLAALSLHCSPWAFSGCGKRGLLSGSSAQASLCVGFSCRRAQSPEGTGFSSCSTQAQLPQSMWNLPRPGIKPVAPELAGRLPTTGPRGKSEFVYFRFHI